LFRTNSGPSTEPDRCRWQMKGGCRWGKITSVSALHKKEQRHRRTESRKATIFYPLARAHPSPHSDHIKEGRSCICPLLYFHRTWVGRLEGPASALPTNLPKANWLGLRLRPPPVADEGILGSSENACIFWGKGRVNGKTAVFPCLGETTVMALALTRSCRGRNFGPTRRRRAKKFRVTAKGRFNEASQKQGLASQEQISPSRLTPTIKTGDAFASPVFIYLRAAPQGPGPLVCSEPIRDQVPSPTAAGGR